MIFAVDPSINDIGFSLFGNDGRYDVSGVIHSKGETDVTKLLSIQSLLKKTIAIFPEEKTIFVIEIPSSFSFGRSTNKTTGKAMNQNALAKLNKAIGVIIVTVLGFSCVKDIYEIPVSEWKGTRGKNLDNLVAKQITGKKSMGKDESDAVMLGDYYIRRERINVKR